MTEPINPHQPDEPLGASTPPQGRPPVNPGGAMPPPPPPPPMYPPPPPGYYPPQAPPAPAKPGRTGRIFGWSVTGLLLSLLLVSILFNVYLAMFFTSVTGGPHEVTYQPGEGPDRIVILPVEGIIGEQTAEFVRQSLQALLQRRPKAIILRVDSPGGAPGPSDRIYHLIKQFKKETSVPVVASFGSVAASGGYYVSAGCDWIVAEPTTFTGSIGVMSIAFTTDKLMDKIGVTPEVRPATDSPEKDVANNIFRPWTDQDRQVQQEEVDHLYDRFIDVVFEGRQTHLQTRERAVELGNGRIFMTDQAVENKLIDAEGYLEAAIDKAKALAGLGTSDKPKITLMRAPVSLGLLTMLGARPPTPSVTAEQVRDVLIDLGTPRLEYRRP